jgi:hypothetical protein
MSTKDDDAVRTTIVGGRPPGSGRSTGSIPRNIEVLVKKAAVDPAFRELLLEQRGAAAAAIQLELDPAEDAMLSAVRREQLAQIVSQTTVPDEQRRVFLGRLAVAMLAIIGGGLASCERAESAGIRPEQPYGTDGIRPDRPTNAPPVWSHGVRPDRPTPGVTNVPAPVPAGIQPDRP